MGACTCAAASCRTPSCRGSSVESLQARIRDAAARGTALRIRGGGTKDFYGNPPRGELLDTTIHAGIVSYEPTELVVTARCGTPLAELEAAVAEKRQCLPFEPPHFGPDATVGGCVAAGLSGPARQSAGALRDFILGTALIDGRGRVLRFGGQVMKNVAGYDVSRLLAGSLGTLGVIAEASLKVLPCAPAALTLRREMPQALALESFNRWGGQPLPVTATAWHEGEAFVRLAGSEPALRAAATRLEGDRLPPDEAMTLWTSVKEQSHRFFAGQEPLWRIAVPSIAAPLDLPGHQFIEWGGGLRWLRSAAAPEVIRAAARQVGGHATLFKAADKAPGAFAPLDPGVLRLHRALKAALDPAGILNPGRMYEAL